jgi:hypothetical protein
MKVIIYKQDGGRVAVIYPAPEALNRYGIEAIALKDVPAGKPFKIIDESALPAEQSERDTWVCDDAALTDGVGAEWDVFPG